jgi:UDP-N-acetylmuramyl pentapeptide phosphotransferase/UDP-N-acetylglucosamine-1-phosphate transferase
VYSFLLAIFASFAVTLLVLRSSRLHAHHTADRDLSKPQRLHKDPVPRIGGLAVMAGMVAAAIVSAHGLSPQDKWAGLTLVACSLPVFVIGFFHDLTDRIPPRGRLLATAISALIAYGLMDAAIVRTDLPGLDWVVGFQVGAVVLTVFTVAGIANAVNIIDGIHGLASMCSMLILAALCYVAFQVNDVWVERMALAGLGAVLGFFAFNYPRGLIFLGDAGAYFLGFFVAELAILLLIRNPTVSPMFPLLACIYPVFETLFSIYRRTVLRGESPATPDGIHLHSLVYRRLMRWAIGGPPNSAWAVTRRNSMTSPVLWMLCMLAIVPATVFWDSTEVLMLFIGLFGVTYTWLYWRIVKFRSPGWMRKRALTPPPRSRRVP